MTDALARLRGSFPPLVTLFRGDAIDFDGFGRLIERHIDGGSHGIDGDSANCDPVFNIRFNIQE